MIILDICRFKKKNLSMALIEYKKDFDSQFQELILKVLNILKTSTVIITLLKYDMERWFMQINLNA